MNLMDKSAAKNMSGPTSCHLQVSHCDRYPALSTPEQVKMWRSGSSLKVLCDDNNVPHGSSYLSQLLEGELVSHLRESSSPVCHS